MAHFQKLNHTGFERFCVDILAVGRRGEMTRVFFKLEAILRGQSRAFEPAVGFRKLLLEVREAVEMLNFLGPAVVEVYVMRVWRLISGLDHPFDPEQLHTTPPQSITVGVF